MLIGISFAAYWRTRWLGIGLAIAGLLMPLAFAITARLLFISNRVPWHPPAIQLVAGERTEVVIRFRSETTERQVDEFVSSRFPFLPDWSESLSRILPTQSDSRAGLVLTISSSAYGSKRASATESKMLADNVSAFMVRMRRDPRVSSIELQTQP